jgi:hypothetical protein
VNATVLVARSLRGMVDGRAEIELGLPAAAGVGELLEVLLKLYPKLVGKMVDDRKSEPGVHFFMGTWDPGARLCLLATLPAASSTEG